MPDEEKAEPTYRQFWVKATDPSVCGVWDRHPQHPGEGGEVFVSGTQPVKVAATPVVLDALAQQRIVEVAGPSIEPPQASQGPPAQAAIGGVSPGDAARKR